MPFLSVIMPAFNAEKTISESIESVLCQTFSDFELIIVNDFSTDKTKEIIEEYAKKDKRIRAFENEKNSGVSFSRNFGVSVAESEWIAFLDSDDLWKPEKLQKQLNLLNEEKNAKLIYTSSSFINWEGEPYTYTMDALPKTDYKKLLSKNLISCSSVLVKKEMLMKYKMPADSMHEDYATWLQILREEDYAYGVSEPLLVYRLSKKSKSSNRIKSGKMIINTYKFLGYSLISVLFLTIRYAFYSVNKRMKIKRSVK